MKAGKNQCSALLAGQNKKEMVIINKTYSPKGIAKYIDHTLLAADATESHIKTLCAEAVSFGFPAVCVNPCYISYAAKLLAGSGVKVCSVVGFHLGALTCDMKAEQAKACIALGAKELDMVANIGAAKSGDWAYVEKDIKAVVDAAENRAAVKVIIEACLLTDEEKIKMCAAAKNAGANFVKTSTGLSKSGAEVHDVKLMRAAVGSDMGVKAAGGIRSYQDAVAMLKAGAERIGTSSGVKIVSK